MELLNAATLRIIIGLALLCSSANATDAGTFCRVYSLVEQAFEQNQAKTIIRLAFHDAMGGLDGRINQSDSEHNGMLGVFSSIETLFNNNQNEGLGRADFFAMVYVAAFYMTVDEGNPPWVSLYYGRANVADGATEDIPPDSEFGSFDHAAVLSYFETNFGFDASHTATLLGAHTLGGAEIGNSGFTSDWTRTPNDFNNDYYERLVDPPQTRWEQVEIGTGTNKFQWRWGCDSNGNGCQDLMLNVDMSLFFDITYDSTGKAVLPSGSSCSSDRIFDTCFPIQTSGTQDIVITFMSESAEETFLSRFAAVYAAMLGRVKTASTLTGILQPDDWPTCINAAECFSKSTTVHVEQRGIVEMQDLRVGDHVWTGKSYEPVYAFGHRHERRNGKFFTIHTADSNQHPLEMTGSHLVFKEEKDGFIKAVPVRELQIGDKVKMSSTDSIEKSVTVTKISTTKKKGLYMPLTPSGTIVVDGIVASNYVSIQKEAPAVVHDSKFFPFLSEDAISHWWMSPCRMICLGISTNFCKTPARDDKGILHWLIVGKSFAEYADRQSFFVRVFVLGLPTFLFFGLLNIVEVTLGGPSSAPVVFMALAGTLVWVLNTCKKAGKSKRDWSTNTCR